MAGYKGYGIAMMIDILAGVLSGSAYLNQVGHFYSQNNEGMNVGIMAVAINPVRVLGEAYWDIIDNYVEILRNSEPIDGMQITIPGDDRIKYSLENSK
jgi:LDH2 family malate/lactate/ureidoglycolate dehydrogenase